MATKKRFAIHPPYLVNRVRSRVEMPGGETSEDRTMMDTLNQMFSELHRYLRYLRDTEDNNQENFEDVDGGLETLGTGKLGHARVMIRVSCGF